MSAEMRHLISTALDGSPEAVQRRIDREECHRLVDRLEGDEVQLMARLLERLDRGRETYGVLRLNDGRKWGKERREEIYDAMVYGELELMAMDEEEGR